MLAPGVCIGPALPVPVLVLDAHWQSRDCDCSHAVASCIAALRRNARLEKTITREPAPPPPPPPVELEDADSQLKEEDALIA